MKTNLLMVAGICCMLNFAFINNTHASCGVPIDLTTTNITTTTATLNFTDIDYNSYQIAYHVYPSGPWIYKTTDLKKFNISGLSPNTYYTWKVQEICSTGPAAFSDSLVFTTQLSAPTGLSATTTKTSSVVLYWNAVSGANEYEVEYSGDDGTTWTSVNALDNTSVTINSLPFCKSFEFQVMAATVVYTDKGTTISNTSVYSASYAFNTNCIVSNCGSPTITAPTNISTTGATLNWDAVDEGVSSYIITYGPAPAPHVKVKSKTVTSTNNSVSISDLSAGIEYAYQVQSVCVNGVSAASSATFYTLLKTPTGLKVKNIGSYDATLTWKAVPGATGYIVFLGPEGDNLAPHFITTNSYSVTNLDFCAYYDCSVEATIGSGLEPTDISDMSATVKFRTNCNYCSLSSSEVGYGEVISQVKVGSIDKTTNYKNDNPTTNTGFENYTGIITNMAQGSLQTCTITILNAFYELFADPYQWQVYIDLNHNGVFESDELMGTITNSGTAEFSTESLQFNIPASTYIGKTVMRIVMLGNYQGITYNEVCGLFQQIDVQDYTVDLIQGSNSSAADDRTAGISSVNEPANIVNLSSLNLYPNPAQDNLTVQFNANNNDKAELNIYNVVGQKMMSRNVSLVEGNNFHNINTSMLSNGVYIFEIENNGDVQRMRFVISK